MERAKLRAFRFTLEGNAKLWYNGLLNNNITSWGQLVRAFLQKYWNASKAIAAEKNLVSIKQQPHENLGEYFQRFKNLKEICPNHGVTEQGLINHFYAGMSRSDRDQVNSACGGTLQDKTAAEANKIFLSLAENCENNAPQDRTSDTITSNPTSTRNSVKTMEHQLTSIANFISNFSPGSGTSSETHNQYNNQNNNAKVYEHCSDLDHSTLQDQFPQGGDSKVQLNAAYGFNQNQQKYPPNNNPYSNTYNPGWRNHPNSDGATTMKTIRIRATLIFRTKHSNHPSTYKTSFLDPLRITKLTYY